MTDLHANANTFRYALTRDTDTASRLAAKAAERKLRAKGRNEQALIADSMEQSPPKRRMEWWETTSPAKCETLVRDLFDAGKWGELLAMHYQMQRLVREKSASETVVVFDADARFKPSTSEKVAKTIVYLTELIDTMPDGEGIADLKEQVAKLQQRLSEHCPVD